MQLPEVEKGNLHFSHYLMYVSRLTQLTVYSQYLSSSKKFFSLITLGNEGERNEIEGYLSKYYAYYFCCCSKTKCCYYGCNVLNLLFRHTIEPHGKSAQRSLSLMVREAILSHPMREGEVAHLHLLMQAWVLSPQAIGFFLALIQLSRSFFKDLLPIIVLVTRIPSSKIIMWNFLFLFFSLIDCWLIGLLI